MVVAEYYVKSDDTHTGLLGVVTNSLKNIFARSFVEIAKVVNTGDSIILGTGTYRLYEELLISAKKQHTNENIAQNNQKLVAAYKNIGIDLPTNPVVIRGNSKNALDTKIIGSITAAPGTNIVFENITFINTTTQFGVKCSKDSNITFINCNITASKYTEPIVYGEDEGSQVILISSLIENDEEKATVFSLGLLGFDHCNIQSSLVLRKNSNTLLSNSSFNCIHAFEHSHLLARNCKIWGNEHLISGFSKMEFYEDTFSLNNEQELFKCNDKSKLIGKDNIIETTEVNPQIVLYDEATAEFEANRKIEIIKNGVLKNTDVSSLIENSEIVVNSSKELYLAIQRALEGDTIVINPGKYDFITGLDDGDVQLLNNIVIQGKTENYEDTMISLHNMIAPTEGNKLIFKNLTLSSLNNKEEISLVGSIAKDSQVVIENCKILANNRTRYSVFASEGTLDLIGLVSTDYKENEINTAVGTTKNGIVNIKEESRIAQVFVQDDGAMNIFDSQIGIGTSYNDGTINIENSTIYDSLFASDNSTINIKDSFIKAAHEMQSGEIYPFGLEKNSRINIDQSRIEESENPIVIPLLNQAMLNLDLVNYDDSHPITIDGRMSDNPDEQIKSFQKINLLVKDNTSNEISTSQDLNNNDLTESKDSIKKQLIELKELLDMGIITEEEFTVKKKKILNI